MNKSLLNSVKINLEREPDANNTSNSSNKSYKVVGGIAKKGNKVILASIHTHPTGGKTIGGVRHEDNANKQKTDLENFKRNNSTKPPQTFPEYMRDAAYYDKIVPNLSNNKQPGIKDNYAKRHNNFNVGKDALTTFGKL